MKNNELKSIKELFTNDEEFKEALEDASIIDKLKTPTKFSIIVEDLEEKLKQTLKTKKNFANNILFVNYKRYLYKHIIELQKTK